MWLLARLESVFANCVVFRGCDGAVVSVFENLGFMRDLI